ncbi:MAG: YcxB family protein [Bacteroidia bacterium]
MEIKTKPFKMTKQAFFRLLFTDFLSKAILTYIVIIILILFFIVYPKEFIAYYLFIPLIMAFLLPLFAAARYWLFVNSSSNKSLYITKQITVNNEKLISESESGNKSIIQLSNITKIKKHKHYTLLYLDASNFIYLPVNAFQSNDEYEFSLSHISKNLIK